MRWRGLARFRDLPSDTEQHPGETERRRGCGSGSWAGVTNRGHLEEVQSSVFQARNSNEMRIRPSSCHWRMQATRLTVVVQSHAGTKVRDRFVISCGMGRQTNAARNCRTRVALTDAVRKPPSQTAPRTAIMSGSMGITSGRLASVI